MKTTLETIVKKYENINYNEKNYSIGGGLDGVKFASRRHEDAKNDEGKLTQGKAAQLFVKATGKPTEIVNAVIDYSFINLEWHHAGKLPKAYGGGMKKTYFLNAEQILELAKTFEEKIIACEKSIEEKRIAENHKKNLETRKSEFLKQNAKRFERASEIPKHPFYIKTSQEMQGKYGWFDSTYKSYKLPEYFSGWDFSSEEKYHEYFSIK